MAEKPLGSDSPVRVGLLITLIGASVITAGFAWRVDAKADVGVAAATEQKEIVNVKLHEHDLRLQRLEDAYTTKTKEQNDKLDAILKKIEKLK